MTRRGGHRARKPQLLFGNRFGTIKAMKEKQARRHYQDIVAKDFPDIDDSDFLGCGAHTAGTAFGANYFSRKAEKNREKAVDTVSKWPNGIPLLQGMPTSV